MRHLISGIVVILIFCPRADLLPLIDDAAVRAQTSIIVRPQLDDAPEKPGAILPRATVKRPRVALVLSGGGARGVAQIGVLKVLERYKIPIDFIAATSMGAIVGGLYAAGYTPEELENLALSTDWDDVLSLGEETKRSELFVDQKLAGDRNFLVVRFQGLEPVIPSAVSTGQRLTEFLSTRTLQALYHGYPDFDHLRIRFRAVATDLISGKGVVLKDGSLAEALRASATVPLLFNPIERDSMQLVDGGLVNNIPVGIARDAGADIILVVNSTSGLRKEDEMKAPWQTADQIMGIMMQAVRDQQLTSGDVVITPDIGRHLSSDFKGLDSLIAQGERSAEQKIPDILSVYNRRVMALREQDAGNRIFRNTAVTSTGGALPDSLWRHIVEEASTGVVTMREIQEHVELLYQGGDYRDVHADITGDSTHVRVVYAVRPNPRLTSVRFDGCHLVSPQELEAVFAPLIGRVINHWEGQAALERVLRIYRANGYSLAQIEAIAFDEATGELRIAVNEGQIHRIDVQGGERTADTFVLNDFLLREGDVFQIEKARRGLSNISSSTLFEYVYLEVTYQGQQPQLTIRLKERPSQLVRVGVRADNERHLQGSLDIRDENFHGRGTELGLSVAGGERNSDVSLEYRAHRLFHTYLTFHAGIFYKTLDSYVYTDAPQTEENRWERRRVGEYRDIRYGGSISFGSQLERLGNVAAEFTLQNVRIRDLDRSQALEERYRLATVRLGTFVDTKDSYPFPTSGIGLNLSYEFSLEDLGSEIGYNALRVMYETYATIARRFTIHPRFTMGFADKTMPFSQQFRLGGRETFFGLREDDRRGRQLLLLNLEVRYLFPVRLLFDTYLKARYDLGTISAVPEEIKFSTLLHGIGAELALATPIGPASLGVGKSFYLSKDLPENPVQQGPFVFYIMIGYQL